MTDKVENTVEQEIAELKQRLDLMGVNYRSNATVESLRKLLKDSLDGADKGVESDAVKANRYREKRRKELLALQRVRVTCMNPMKKNVPGEVVSFCNSTVGAVRKYVPFNGKAFHVETCLVNILKGREFTTSKQEGKGIRAKNVLITSKEFAIEVLEPLSEEELKELAETQRAKGSLED